MLQKINTYKIVCLFNSENESLNLVFANQLMWIQSRKLNRTLFTLRKFNFLHCESWVLLSVLSLNYDTFFVNCDFLWQYLWDEKIKAAKIKCFRIIVLYFYMQKLHEKLKWMEYLRILKESQVRSTTHKI